MKVEIEPVRDGEVENEIKVFITTEVRKWHVFNVAPSYGIRRVVGIEDPELPTDDRGRVIIR
jgi:hypothetical protein